MRLAFYQHLGLDICPVMDDRALVFTSPLWSKADDCRSNIYPPKNYDSTEDSICMNCFLTVARGNESSLEEAEQKHDCEQAIGMNADGTRIPNGEHY